MLSHLGRRTVMITGMPLFAKRAANVIQCELWKTKVIDTEAPRTLMQRRLISLSIVGRLPAYDMVYQVGGPVVVPYLLAACKVIDRPVVLHWIGTDVLQASRGNLPGIVRRQNMSGKIVHWVDAPWLAQELAAVGIEAEEMSLCAVEDTEPPKMPSGPLTVLLYLPDGRFEFYGGSAMLKMAEKLPNVKFSVVGGKGLGGPIPPNVQFLGWRKNMASVYARSHVLVRMVNHDGQSFMVTEALNCGRHVIWNYPCSGANLARSTDEVTQILARFSDHQLNGTLRLNDAGRAYAQQAFGTATIGRRMRLGLEAALRTISQRRSQSALICGLPYFASRTAANLKRSGWRTHVVNTGAPGSRLASRIALLRTMLTVPFSDVVYQIGGPNVNAQLLKLCEKLSRPVVLHWAGSDVLKIGGGKEPRLKDANGVSHWAVAPWLVDELHRAGIDATYVPPNVVDAVTLTQLPKAPLKVLVYLPYERIGVHAEQGGMYEFYGGFAIAKVAEALPDIQITVVGGRGPRSNGPANMHFAGWQRDMPRLYNENHVLVRLTKHDGLSNMVTEALNFGRYVIWTYPFPGVFHVTGVEEVVERLRELDSQLRAGLLGLNIIGQSFVQSNFSARRIQESLARRLDETLLVYKTG